MFSFGTATASAIQTAATPDFQDMADVESELKTNFGLQCSPEFLSEAASICRVCGISPEDLFYKWEAFMLGHPGQQLDLNVENLRELRKEIVKPAIHVKQEHPNSFGTPAAGNAQLKKSLGRQNFDSM